MQVYHNTRLKEDALAGLGTNNVIYRAAAYFLDDSDRHQIAGLGITPEVWHSKEMKRVKEARYAMRLVELLKWAGVDRASKLCDCV